MLLLSLLALLGACQKKPPADATPVANAPSSPGYTGSASCRECHEKFYRLWAPSHHGLAMQPYTADLARTNLTAQKLAIKIGSRSYQADLFKSEVVERGARGEKRYSMVHAMGGKNVFYFLTPLERGRLQVLPVAYDLNRQEWFDTTGSAVRHFGGPADEALDWQESPLTFNTACFSCHVSQLAKNYDLKSDSYHTTLAEPGINCETCHWPAIEHVRLAQATPKGQPLPELRLISAKPFTQEQMNSQCGSCHARMSPLTASFNAGERFFDHFSLATLENADFYPDGRDLGENFTLTTWRQSPCVKSSKLTCLTCHTSSGRFRFKGEQVNNACLPCHESNVKNAAAHSHHPAASEGAKCVSCHMPMTEFARMRRSDHSMRPPTPATTLAYGSPNACNICHTNQDAGWADRYVRQWRTRDYQAPVLQRAAWIAGARKRDWTKLHEIVNYLASPAREEIGASSLIQLLRACDDEAKWAGIMPCLKDSSPLVRAAAVEAVGDRLSPETILSLLAATRDEYRLVRLRAAAVLAPVARETLNEADRKALTAASDELLASYRARPDDTASQHNLGNYLMERREYDRAIEAFEISRKLDPNSVSPLVNVALAYNAQGQNAQAEASLRRARQLDPTNGVVNLNLGMLLAEMNKLAEAESAFRTAFKSESQSAQAAYNLGVLLSKTNPHETLRWCQRAADLRPQEARYAYTLAFYQNQQGLTREAVKTLEKLIQQAPPHVESYGLLVQLYEAGNRVADAVSVYRRAADNVKLPEPQRAVFRDRAKALAP